MLSQVTLGVKRRVFSTHKSIKIDKKSANINIPIKRLETNNGEYND